MIGEPMRIHMRPDPVPFKLYTARQIAYGMRDEVEAEIKSMLQRGIIEPVGDEYSEWTHPLVVVRKPNGKPRVVVDFVKLNAYVQRPVHPFRTPENAVRGVKPKDSSFFSTLDATSGYWQVELAKEDRPLTTFITPWGLYRYTRSPMGLSSTGDEYCRRGDLAINGLPRVEKVVDDLLVHSDNFEQHLADVKAVLDRCRQHGITLSPSKFVFAKPEVAFVGFLVNRQGVDVDPRKIEAIKNFPRPENVMQVRSFLGPVN